MTKKDYWKNKMKKSGLIKGSNLPAGKQKQASTASNAPKKETGVNLPEKKSNGDSDAPTDAGNTNGVDKKTKEYLGSLPIVVPAVDAVKAVEIWETYQNLLKAILEPSDIQKIEGKPFKKKSYWRKAATFFNLTVKIINERKEEFDNGNFAYHFTAKATANNGRYAIGTGSCDAFEKAKLINGEWMRPKKQWNPQFKKMIAIKDKKGFLTYEPAEPNSIHNVRATAETRAFNRAVANMVAAGEVSAEEVQGD